LHSSGVREKRRAVILTQEFTDEGAYLSVCVAHICCRYGFAGRNLRPDRGDRTDDGPGHLDFKFSNDHDQEEAFLKVAPCQKEVEEIVRCSDELSQSKISSSQRKLTQPSRYEAQWWRCARRFALPPSASPGRVGATAAGGSRRAIECSAGQLNERRNLARARSSLRCRKEDIRSGAAFMLELGHSFRVIGDSLNG
jgi:hypothetical protein